MTPTRTKPTRVIVLALSGVAFAAAGAGAMYVYLQDRRPGASSPGQPVVTPSASGEVAITLTPEGVSRAGIRTAKPAIGQIGAAVTLPGIVEPNTYNQVTVRSVAAGQVLSVAVELGAQVKRGDLLATIHSPDLAETVRAYLSMRSEFDAAHQRLTRLENLVKIGAASQQELETAKAEHTRHVTDVESAQAKLTLLGLTTTQVVSLKETAAIDSTVRITAPRHGVITTRTINTGANIDGSTELFTVADLSAVWIMASVYERDLGRLTVGSTASITTPVMTGRRWSGRVGYIDPQLAPETRTAKVRVEVPNADRVLRFGMYASVSIAASGAGRALLVPRTAVQTIGAQSVVYVSDPQRPGRYIERSVALGPVSGPTVEVLAGVDDTDEVVVDGSFSLRAERDRLGLPPPVPVVPPAAAMPDDAASVEKIAIAVTKAGFVPASTEARAGVAIELVFTRRTNETCANEVEVPDLKVRKALPLNKPVSVTLPAGPARTVGFACGINMLKGTVVVR